MEGDRMNVPDGDRRKYGWRGLQSSKAAPHFGHFASVSSTSAPQFVHVKAVAFEAFPPKVRAGSALPFGASLASSLAPSFGTPDVRLIAFARASRARWVYHQRKRIATYVTTARIVIWPSAVT